MNLDSEPVISVENLRKTYRGNVQALDGVSFSVDRGEFFGIIGPNGAGKTTTLSLFEGLTAPTSGTVTICGESPWPRNPKLLAKLGVQLQSSALFERLSVIEEVTAFTQLFPPGSRSAEQLVDLVGLSEVKDRRQERLSGGQRQRLMIATALVNDPEVLILDEPTAGLDPAARRDLHALLQNLVREGVTVVYTSHDLADIERLSDRVAILDKGRLLAIDTPTRLIAQTGKAATITIAADLISSEDAKQLPGVQSVEAIDGVWKCSVSDLNSAIASLAAVGLAEYITIEHARLEDIYLGLVEDEE